LASRLGKAPHEHHDRNYAAHPTSAETAAIDLRRVYTRDWWERAPGRVRVMSSVVWLILVLVVLVVVVGLFVVVRLRRRTGGVIATRKTKL